MKSFEAMGMAIGRDRVEHAKALHKSVHLVSKWAEPSTDFTDSGTFNPLDRIETIVETALKIGNVAHPHALAPLYYLAVRFNCLLLPIPAQHPCLQDLSARLCIAIKEFGEMVAAAGEAMQDGVISPDERRVIEKKSLELMESIGLFTKMVQELSR